MPLASVKLIALVGQTSTQEPHPIQSFEGSSKGVDTFFVIPLSTKEIALVPSLWHASTHSPHKMQSSCFEMSIYLSGALTPYSSANSLI